MSCAIITDVQYILSDNVETNDFLVADMNLSWSADDILPRLVSSRAILLKENNVLRNPAYDIKVYRIG